MLVARRRGLCHADRGTGGRFARHPATESLRSVDPFGAMGYGKTYNKI